MAPFIVFYSLFMIFIEFASAQNQCQAPYGSIGSCIPLNKCRTLGRFSSLPTFLMTQEQRQFITQYQCGNSYFTLYVCCPSQTPSQQQLYSSNSPLQNSDPWQNILQSILSNLLGGPNFQSMLNPSQGLFGSQFSSQGSFGPQTPSESSFGAQIPSPSLIGTQIPSQSSLGSQIPSQGSFGSQVPSHGLIGSQQQRFTESDLPPPGRCGTQTKDRIVGGEETSIQDYPWMTLLHYSRYGQPSGFLCGGSLINEYYVLTAAHCVKGASLIRSRLSVDSVRLGEHDLRTEIDCEEGDCADPVVDIRVIEQIVHENYVPSGKSQQNDIALLRLAYPAPYTDFIRPICLPIGTQVRNKDLDNVPLVVAGFGRIENGSQSDVKLKLEMNGFNLIRCEQIYHSLSNTQLCAGGELGKDSCNGDSGGPLMGEDNSNPLIPYSYLAGIVSFGPAKCGSPGLPGVYTRVDQYIDWIVSHMKK